MSRGRRKALSPSLFPFLAVLVCTLGTLILLLALVAQSATDAAERSAREQQSIQQQAERRASQPNRLTAENVSALMSQEQYRVEHLVSLRKKQTADLEDRRDQVTHLEEHLLRLESELKRLNEEMKLALQQSSIENIDDQDIESLRARIASKEAEVEELVKKAGEGSRRIVIVPHKGPNGTDRRPIYLECTSDGVTIWPEGSRITHEELINAQRGLVRSANPLDAALRTIRHHAMQRYGETTPPYPLLVVRPDGIESYAAARHAMQDWDEQFGYELVAGDVELAYRDPDSALKDRVDLAIRAAVANQQPLALSASTNARARGGSGRRRFPTLSAARLDRDGRANGFGSLNGADRSANPFVNNRGYGGNRGYAGAQSGLGPNMPPSANRRTPTSMNQPPGSTRSQPATGTGRSTSLDRRTVEDMRRAAAEMRRGSDPSVVSDQRSGQPNEVPSAELIRNPNDVTGTVGSGFQSNPPPANTPQSSGQSEQESSFAGTQASSQASSQAAPQTSSQTSAQSSSQASQTSSSTSQTSQSASSAAASQTPPDPSAAPPSPNINVDMTQQPTDLVRPKGRDWALPDSLRGIHGNAIVRTLHVECFKDRYVLLPSSGGGALEMFGISDVDADLATLKLATALRDRIARWGAALPGGRWKPQLNVVVKEGGEERFTQLDNLMRDSGIDVIRRSSK